MPMAAAAPPQKCIMLSIHGNLQYKEKIILIIWEIKRKIKKAASILLKFFPKIILSRKNRTAIGGKLTRRKPGGCPHCPAKAGQNVGLPRINFNLESLPWWPFLLYAKNKMITIKMGNAGIEPAAFPVWRERSATELIAPIQIFNLSL